MKLTPRVQKVICDAIEAGHYKEAAAEAAGISRRTLYAWMDRGAKEKGGVFQCFHNAFQKAQAESETRLVEKLVSVATGERDWRAFAWMLERRWPERWGNGCARRPSTKYTGTLISADGDRASYVAALKRETGEQ